MTVGHLCQKCTHIAINIRKELILLKDKKSSAGSGRKYWSDGARVLGIYEIDGGGLRFALP
jgi:hypothetical protein